MRRNMKTVLLTGESKGWVFNDDIYTVGIRRQQSGLVVIIWGGMVGNELTSLFRESEDLNCPLTCIARS